MATNPPAGDGHRNGAVRKRTQVKTKVMGESALPNATRRQASSSTKRPPLRSSRAYGEKKRGDQAG